MADYLPRREGPLRNWAANFAARIAAAPGEHGVLPEQAEAIESVVNPYLSAYAAAFSREGRSRTQVLVRNQARVDMLQVVRRFARLIKANPQVTDTVKSDLGLSPGSARARSRLSAPKSRPLLYIMTAGIHQHLLRYGDAANPDGRCKPADVIGLQLFCHIGTAAPIDPLEARFQGFVTRQPYLIQFKQEQGGHRAFYYARWQTATGQTGPWSDAVGAMVLG